MTPFAFRRVTGLLHLAAAALIGWSTYRSNARVDQLVAWTVFGALAATGLAMWFAPRFLRRSGRVL
jgi:hypothetical protein